MISIVIPICNEVENLETLYEEIDAASAVGGFELEIVFVDDGSTDGSWVVIEQLAASDARVRGIRFRRNFGKSAALNAGFCTVRGDLVMTLDGDLQDDPSEIPRFVAKIQEGFDVVSGWKQIRHDPWCKVVSSRLFNGMVRGVTGLKLHDINCGMKCYRREVLAEVHLYGEMHRFVPLLAAARGFRIGEIVIGHRARKHGNTKYGSKRLLKGILDLMTVIFLTGYSQRPLHLMGTVGLGAFALGGLGMFSMSVWWVISRLFDSITVFNIHETALLYYSLGALLLGGQLLSLGLLAEMIAAQMGRGTDNYSIMEETNPLADSTSPGGDSRRHSVSPDEKTRSGDV